MCSLSQGCKCSKRDHLQGDGSSEGETKGCVRLVLSQITSPPEAAQVSEIEHPRTLEGETKPSEKDLNNTDGAAVASLTPNTAPTLTDAEFTVEVLPEKSSSEEGQKPADVEETDVPDASDSSSGKSSSGMDPVTDEKALSKENGGKFKDNEGPSVVDARDEDGIPEPSAPAQYSWSWYLPWGIACCKPKEPQSKDQEVVVKQRPFQF